MTKLFLALALSCLTGPIAVAETALTQPQSATFEVRRNKMYDPGVVATGFQELEDGTYALLVEVQYVSTFQSRYAFQPVTFPNDGYRLYAVGSDLYLKTSSGQDVRVGHYAWWQSPQWRAVDGVQFRSKIDKVSGDRFILTTRLVQP